MSQFSTTGAITAPDANNMVRGYYRDNSNHAVTGTTNETDLASTTITANDVGAAGSLNIYAAGTVTNAAAGAKTIKLYFGATAIVTVSRTGANAQDWLIWAKLSNTATGAQRINYIFSTADAVTISGDYTTSAIDTTSGVICKVTGTLANSGDTITQTMFEIDNVQRT